MQAVMIENMRMRYKMRGPILPPHLIASILLRVSTLLFLLFAATLTAHAQTFRVLEIEGQPTASNGVSSITRMIAPVDFLFKHPSASTVSLAGSFNNWNASSHPMQRGPEGEWSTTLQLDVQQEYQYKFVVDGQHWRHDENNSYKVQDGFGGYNSVVVSAPSSATGEAVFTVSASKARAVFLMGDFNGWDPESLSMTKNENGVWTHVLNLPMGAYRHAFVVDGKIRRTEEARWDYDAQGEKRDLVFHAPPTLFSSSRYHLRLKAPFATSVHVAGDFNSWSTSSTPLEDPDGDGVWDTVLALVPGIHEYKFVLDGIDWITDPLYSARS